MEWTWTVLEGDLGQPLLELHVRFREIFESAQTIDLTSPWIDAYEARRRLKPIGVENPELSEQIARTPRPVQELALRELELLRHDGECRALVIAATGLGKTFLAAFDSLSFHRVLFIAHREELLRQAAGAFREIRPGDTIGFVGGGRSELDRDMVFASIQSLGAVLKRDSGALAGFDYVVMDEFHHAAAPTYLALLERIRPRFLLGLTATPYRGDNRDLYALCHGNVAYEIGLFTAIGLGWLAPFHYYGIADVAVYDDTLLNAAKTGYDDRRLTTLFDTDERSQLALQHYRGHPSRAALGFCVSIEHARYMECAFNAANVAALAVHSGPGAADRRQAVADLISGRVRILFVVDLFNEGVDIPRVDLVLFLRPTESMTVFIQQLGRGLRLDESKKYLTVLDFIGNYRRAQFKLPFLVGLEDEESTSLQLAARLLTLEARRAELPAGITITLDPIALEHLKNAIDRPGNLRQQLIAEFRELTRESGRRPQLLDLERRGRHSARQFCRSFGSWHAVLGACSTLTDAEQALEIEVGPFLKELERTAMTRSYKMVLLEAMLKDGQFKRCISLAEIAQHFREHFSKERFRHEIAGSRIADITAVSKAILEAYIIENPVNAWIGGNTPTRTSYFRFDLDKAEFSRVGPDATDQSLFASAVAMRVAWRLETHLSRPGPGRTVYKVIPHGSGACIMLGPPSGDGLPRDGGWQVVRINGRLVYAKFAKIAVNWLAEAQDGVNILTQELTTLLGADLLRFDAPHRVIVSRVADSAVYAISAPEASATTGIPLGEDRPYTQL